MRFGYAKLGQVAGWALPAGKRLRTAVQRHCWLRLKFGVVLYCEPLFVLQVRLSARPNEQIHCRTAVHSMRCRVFAVQHPPRCTESRHLFT